MAIALHFNSTAKLRLQEVRGRTTAREFSQLLQYYAAHPEVANADVVTFIDVNAELAVTSGDMLDLREELIALQKRVLPAVILRSAWICPNAGSWSVLEDWLNGRHSLDGMATEVILVANLDATDLLFERDEIAIIRERLGFQLLERFSAEPAYS